MTQRVQIDTNCLFNTIRFYEFTLKVESMSHNQPVWKNCVNELHLTAMQCNKFCGMCGLDTKEISCSNYYMEVNGGYF